MAILLAIWAVCFMSMTSRGAWGTAEFQQIFIPKNDSHVSIPCVGLKPDERPSLLYWFIGKTWEMAKDSRVFKFSDPSIGQNHTVDDRYSLSYDFGLVIDKIDTTDSRRYWCRVIRATGEEIPEAVDVTVFIRDLLPGPVIWWESSGSPISKVNVRDHQILNCSVNNVYPNPDLTWSFIGCRNTANRSMELLTSNQQSTYDVFSNTYHVTKRAYFGALDLKTDDNCEFECIAKGVAIRNGSSFTVVEIFATALQQEPNSAGSTSAFIILALVLIVCFIALMYFMYRVRRMPQRRVVKYKQHEPREPTGTPDEKTGLCMEQKSNEMKDITADGSTQWASRGILEDYKNVFQKDSESIGDIWEVIGDGQELLLATSETVIRYPNKQNCKPEIFTKDKFSGNVTSIVVHPQSETLIVGLNTKQASLIFFDMNSGSYKDRVELKKFTSPKVTVDGAGNIFVGDLGGKIINVFESGSKTPMVYTSDINKMRNIAAYGWKHLFVGNGKDTIMKYNFKRNEGCLDMVKVNDCINITPADDKKGLGEIAVHDNRLYVVNDNRILAYDVEVFQMLHVFETGFANLRGLCFFGLTGVALYSTKRVHIYEIKKVKKEEGNSSTTVQA